MSMQPCSVWNLNGDLLSIAAEYMQLSDLLAFTSTCKYFHGIKLHFSAPATIWERIAAKIPNRPFIPPYDDSQYMYNLIRAQPKYLLNLHQVDLQVAQIAVATLLARGKSVNWICNGAAKASINIQATIKALISTEFISKCASALADLSEIRTRNGEDLLDRHLECKKFYPTHIVAKLRTRLIEHFCVKQLLHEYDTSCGSRQIFSYRYSAQELIYLNTLHPGIPNAVLRNASQCPIQSILTGCHHSIHELLKRNPHTIRYVGLLPHITPLIAERQLLLHPLSFYSWPNTAVFVGYAKTVQQKSTIEQAAASEPSVLAAIKYDPLIALLPPCNKSSEQLKRALFYQYPKIALSKINFDTTKALLGELKMLYAQIP